MSVHRRATFAALLIALVLSGCTDDGPQDPAGDAAKAFLAAWASGDTARAGALTDDPAAARALLDETADTLRLTGTELTAGASTGDTDEGPATVAFQAELTLASLGQWAYDGSLQVLRTGERWLVDWSPAVVHPELTEATLLSRERDLLPRAAILDGGGRELMSPQPVVDIGIEPRRLAGSGEAYAVAARLLDVDRARLEERVAAAEPEHFVPVITLREPAFAALRTRLEAVDGFVFRDGMRTLAPTPTFARGILGTAPLATAETLETAGPLASEADDIGASGLQAAFQDQLAGEPAGAVRLLSRENRGVVATLHEWPGTAGTPLRTTLDLATQRAAEDALSGVEQPASLVALRASTGDVLAAANAPGADASNRAFTGQYPPGSTFKVVTTAALLDRGLGTDDIVACPRTATVDGRAFGNANDFALGAVPFRRDFAQSCNTAFVTLAQDLPADALAQQADAFGLGAEWDLGLPAFTGSVPVTEAPVERAAASIGQGEVLASPLAMASVAAAVASGSVRAPVLLPERPTTATAAGDLPSTAAKLPPATVSTLQSLMREVVVSGSAQVLDLPGAPVAAKTGTAEYGEEVPPRTHAWIIGYRGDVAFAVILEDGGAGGRDAAPVARAFLERLG